MIESRPTIFVTRKLPDNVESRLVRDYSARLNDDDRLMAGDALVAGASGADGILACTTERFSADVISRLSESVRIIATFSVGYNHIDVDAAKDRGIVVTNTPDVLTDATAEVAMLLMLGAARRAYEGERLVREAKWATWSPTFMLGTQLTGKRLGLLGMGRIGQATAQRARGFGMEVHYHNRRRLPSDREQGAEFHENLDEFLTQIDVLSIHCPASDETYHLLDGDRIARLPAGAIVVNTARGEIVDDNALIGALQSGHLRAAGLDVYENEPNLDPRYRTLDNVFLMPHIGSATDETRDAMGFRALDNLDAYFSGEEPGDRVV